MKKVDKLRHLLRHEWVTPLTALRECGLLSLSQRITHDIEPNLPEGKKLLRRWVTTKTGSRVMSYRIV